MDGALIYNIPWIYEAYVSKYRLLYMVVSEPIKSFVGYLRKGNTGWELISTICKVWDSFAVLKFFTF